MHNYIKKILYTTDLSSNSAHAFRYALKLAVDNQASMVVLHVIEDSSIYNAVIMGGILTDEKLEQIIAERNAKALERVENRIGTVSHVEFGEHSEKAREYVSSVEICQGFPVELILSKADEFECDVIVMGTHGKGKISQTFLGGTAKRVLRRTRIPVFIIPLPEDAMDVTVKDQEWITLGVPRN